jgi:hypothetical protein
MGPIQEIYPTMDQKKCIIISKSGNIANVLRSYDYETIVFSDSPSALSILSSICPYLLVIDSDIENGRSLIPQIFALPKVPEKITIRDASADPFVIGQEKIIHVSADMTDAVWGEVIQHNATEDVTVSGAVPKKDKILIIDDVAELSEMYKIMFELKGYEVDTAHD